MPLGKRSIHRSYKEISTKASTSGTSGISARYIIYVGSRGPLTDLVTSRPIFAGLYHDTSASVSSQACPKGFYWPTSHQELSNHTDNHPLTGPSSYLPGTVIFLRHSVTSQLWATSLIGHPSQLRQYQHSPEYQQRRVALCTAPLPLLVGQLA